MKILKKMLSNLQTHIITVFSLLLFISFAMVGLIFNIAMNRYVSTGAAEALAEARATHEMQYSIRPGLFVRVFGGNQRFMLRETDFFVVNENYEVLSPIVSSAATTVLTAVYENQIPLVLTDSTRIRTQDFTFFVSIVPIAGNSAFTVFYLDVSGILDFAGVVNRLLITLVTLIWLISMIIAGFLADSMVRPLKVLRNFVTQIGSGDFSQSSFTFSNEEFEELNQTLNHTARQLAGYDNDQKTFFQNVSHELRTPLMSIKSYAEGIKYNIMEPIPASETILEATDRLTGMVDDILYVSRIDNLTMPNMDNFNICEIIEERIRHQRHMAKNRGLAINFISDGDEILVPCVLDYIVRAIDNLISNAIRYAASTVTIECYAIGSRVNLRITDDGPGFEPDSLPHVFERFYRGKNGITGIGLAIVKSITDQHKGTATAENGAENGAILTISLPRTR